ncbi:twin-arginine translocation signal domain-containing protein [Helicobacter jaachi]|uniref:Twin-arginine translocation signal domain-containing protein n=1 Tax=Helicobacter jaachi TaxID=1677920 RepID=A0A4U8TE21_9HELI|nr:twin-arginine translocation signal domain-containing protein [Helicobacter jaachi]TLD97568.1 twin-arginine translocation signal domain-containing protein [Helicobacter jaachi]
MSNMQEEIQSRRKFLKAAGVGGAVVAIGSLSLNGCSGEHTQKEVIKGKSKKQEVLYRGDTKYWQTYFSVAK